MNQLRYILAFTKRQYLSLGLNMLANTLKVSRKTKAEFFDLIFFQGDEKT